LVSNNSTGQNGGTLSGSGIFLDACGSFVFNVTDVGPLAQFPDFDVEERSEVPLPPSTLPASSEVCYPWGDTVLFSNPCSLTILGNSASPTDIRYYEADVFDHNCVQQGSVLDPVPPEVVTAPGLSETLKIQNLSFGQTGAIVDFCYGTYCTNSTATQCIFRKNPFNNPNRFTNTFMLSCAFVC
jgi:hypothetical protein